MAGLWGSEYLLNAFCMSGIGKALEISFNSHTPQIIPQAQQAPARTAARNWLIFIRSLETQSSDELKK